MAPLSIVCFLLLIYGLKIEASISDKRLCADPKCSIVISVAKVLLTYSSPDYRLVSLKPGETVHVYSKEAGNRTDLWGVKVNGRRGYAPKSFLQEFKVYIPTKNLKDIVSTEEESVTVPYSVGVGVSAESVPENILSLENISSPVEVIDGTTMYLSNENVLGSPPIQATAVDPSLKPSLSPQEMSGNKVVENTEKILESEVEEEDLDEEGSGEEDEEEDEGEEDEEEVEDEENPEETPDSVKNKENLVEPPPTGGSTENKENLVEPHHTGGSTENKESLVEPPHTGGSTENKENLVEPPHTGGSTENKENLVEPQHTEDSTKNKENFVEPQHTGGSAENRDNLIESQHAGGSTENKENLVEPQHTGGSTENKENLVEPQHTGGSAENRDNLIESQHAGSSAENSENLVEQQHVENTAKNMNVDSTAADIKEHADVTKSDAESESNETVSLEAIVNEVADHTPSTPTQGSDIPLPADLNQVVNITKSETEAVSNETASLEAIVADHTPTEESNIPLSTATGERADDIKNDTETVSEDPVSLQAENIDSTASEGRGIENILTPPPFFLQRKLTATSGDDAEDKKSTEELKTMEGLVTEEAVLEYGESMKDGYTIRQPETSDTMKATNIGDVDNPTEPLNTKQEQPDHISEQRNVRLDSEEAEDILQANTNHIEQESISNQSEDSEIPPEPILARLTEELEQNSEEIFHKAELKSESPIIATEPKEDTQQINLEQATTESSYESLNDDILYDKEDPVTESYRHAEEPAVEVSEEVVVEELPPEPVFSTAEEEKPALVEEEGPGTLSRIVDTVFSLYGQLSNLILSSSAVDEKVEEIDLRHEGDQVPSHTAAAMDDSSSDVATSNSQGLFPQSVMDEPELLYTPYYFVVSAVTILLFTLGYYFIQGRTQDGKFLEKINRLEKALLASSKEVSKLQEQLEQANERAVNVEDTTSTQEIIVRLEEELRQAKATRLELEEQVTSLEKELDTATDAGLELNRMLSELLTAQNGSDSLAKSVGHLQKQLDSQRGALAEMNSTLSAKSQENESLQADLNIALERIKSLEEELRQVNETVTSLHKEKDDLDHDYQLKNLALEKQFTEALESKSAESQRLSRELQTLQEVLDETRRTLASRDSELEVLRAIIQKMDGETGSGDSPRINLEELTDVGRVRAELVIVTKERDSYKERLQGEEEARNLLQDHVQIVSEEVDNLRSKLTLAENAKVEAQLRLEVLSNYFKEKETQMQKEIGHQEALFVQKEGDIMSTSERIKSLQEEVEHYKSQNELLKKEILDQERGLKAQIATLEKKAHENWVVARQTERRLEEVKQENGLLRNNLTMAERNRLNNSDVPKLNDHYPVETNGEHPTSPVPLPGGLQDLPGSPFHFGLPISPPPGQPPMHVPPMPPFPFMPGPHPMLFPPPMVGDHRPPPLGRPPSPYDHSPPESPPGRSFRSPPRYDRSPPRYHPSNRFDSPPRNPGRSYRSPPRYDRSPSPSYDHPSDRERYRRRPPSPRRSGPNSPYDRPAPPRTSFRPVRRDSPHESKGSGLSSGHSSESLDKSSRHSGRV